MEWSHPLLDHRRLLSIGWAEFGARPSFVRQLRHDWSKVSNIVEGEWGKVRSRFGLQRFLEMEHGDWVVVPTWGAFHVYRVSDHERLVPGQIGDHLTSVRSWHGKSAVIREGRIEEQSGDGSRVIDLGFFRRVEPLARDIPRNEYADAALTARMKVRQTNVEITDLRDSIEESIKRYDSQRPINFRSFVMEKCASDVRKTILVAQSPEQFEKLISQYFERPRCHHQHSSEKTNGILRRGTPISSLRLNL